MRWVMFHVAMSWMQIGQTRCSLAKLFDDLSSKSCAMSWMSFWADNVTWSRVYTTATCCLYLGNMYPFVSSNRRATNWQQCNMLPGNMLPWCKRGLRDKQCSAVQSFADGIHRAIINSRVEICHTDRQGLHVDLSPSAWQYAHLCVRHSCWIVITPRKWFLQALTI